MLHVKNAAAKLGITDGDVTHRNVKLKAQEPIGDSLVFLMIGRDAVDGQMRLTPLRGCFDIRWRKSDSARLFAGIREVAGELAAAAAEAKSFFALDAAPLGKFITVHPLGGCPMSDNPAAGVTDDRGRVCGYDGLDVLDGSIVYPDWLQVHSELNASGVVDSPFTKRVGISTPHFTP